MDLVESARALYSISTIVEIVCSICFRSHHDDHFHWRLWDPFGSIGLAFRYIKSCARFVARYISRGRKRRSRSPKRLFAIESSKVSSEISEALELESGKDLSTSLELPPDPIRSNSSAYRTSTTQKPLITSIHGDTPMVAMASDYHAKDTTTCWSCAHPSCSTYTITAPPPSIEHHIDHCAPYCHGCYFRCVCRQQYQSECVCGAKVNTNPTMRLVCEPCSLLSPTEIDRRRGAREKRELALLAGQAMRCANCALGLPNRGPRWWVCNLCRLECVDRCHYED